MVDPAIKPIKLAEAVAARIEDLMRDGALRPGDRLAPERELAQKLDVSRPSLRDGLKILQDKGLIEADRGDGARIARIGFSVADPLLDLLATHPGAARDYLEFRLAVEPEAAAHAALRAAEPDRAAISAALARIEASHIKADPHEEALADAGLHLSIYEASHNVVLLHVMRALAEMLRAGALYDRDKFYTGAGMRGILIAQHREIVAAVLAREAEAAREAARRHVAFTMEALEEIQSAEARLAASLRRLSGEGLTAIEK